MGGMRKITTSNRTVDQKTPMFTLAPAFQLVAERENDLPGAPHRDSPRTRPQWLIKLSSLVQTKDFIWPKLKAGDLLNESDDIERLSPKFGRGTVIHGGLTYVPVKDGPEQEEVPSIQLAA